MAKRLNGKPAGNIGKGGKEVVHRWIVPVNRALVGGVLSVTPRLVARSVASKFLYPRPHPFRQALAGRCDAGLERGSVFQPIHATRNDCQIG